MLNINKEIESFLLRKQEQDKHENVIGKYSPSMLAMCLRRQYYEYKYPMSMPVDKLKIFEMGNSIHERIATILSASPNVKINHAERSLTLIHPDFDDIIISGRLDNFLIMQDGGKNVIIEVKSAKALQTYDPQTRSFTEMTEPKPDHVLQLNFYLFAIPGSLGLLLYVNKNTFETKQFEIKPDKALLMKGLERAKILHTALKSNTFPEAEAKMSKETNWACNPKYCQFAERCGKLPLDEVKDNGKNI
jgi:hypothetical protein